MQTALDLLQSETLFKTIYEESPIGIEIYDSIGRLLHANRACLQMFGIDDIGDVQGFNLFADPNVPDKEREGLRNGYPIKFEVAFDFEIVKKLGLFRTSKEGKSHLSVIITPLKSGDGSPQGYLVQVLDDTERKQAEQELIHSHQVLESCVRERTSELVDSNRTLEREISQRNETERLLQEKNEILESIFSNIQFLAAYMDPEFNFIRVNRAYADTAGHPPEFFIGKNHFELYPHADNETVFRKVVETGEPYFIYEKAFEYAEYPERGVTYWDWSLHPVKEPTGEVKGVVLNLIDVTKRKQAEIALSSEKQRLFSVLDKLPAFVRLQTSDYSIPFANQYFRDRFGNPEGRPCYDTLHGWSEPCVTCPTYQVFQTEKPVEWECASEADGKIYHIYDYPFWDYDGSFQVIQLGIDITERKQAEEAHRQSEEKFRLLAETIQDVFWMGTPGAKEMLYVSPGYEKMWGRTCKSLYEDPLSFMEPVHPEDREKLLANVESDVGGEHNIEYRIIQPDGSVRWIYNKSFPILCENGKAKLIAGVARDITERKQAENKLQEYASQLEMRNRELQSFASVASHDLQEPLRKIQAFGDRLKNKYQDILDEDGRDYLDRMQNAAGRMQDLINRLLEYSRITIKGRPFELVNLTALIKGVLSDLEVRIEKTDGRVEVEDLASIEADPLQMRQLFQNLIGNALKFHGEQAPAIRIHGEFVRKGQSYRLFVEDNGIGFDEKHLDRIFAPFERLHGRSEYEGTGMGLAICRKIVERHGGTITARSKPGKGAIFIISLRLKHSS